MTELKQKFVCFDCVDENAKLVLHRYEGAPEVVAAMCKRVHDFEMSPAGRGKMRCMRRVQEWPETA
jgi:hypothetical protein